MFLFGYLLAGKHELINSSSESPYLSLKMSGPSVVSLSQISSSSPFKFDITIHHHEATASGNPANKPVTFYLADTYIAAIDDWFLSAYMVLHHSDRGLTELPAASEETSRVVPFPFWPSQGELSVSVDNGFVSLSVDEELHRTISLAYIPGSVGLNVGERYSLIYKGVNLDWWKFGSLEVSLLASISPDWYSVLED